MIKIKVLVFEIKELIHWNQLIIYYINGSNQQIND